MYEELVKRLWECAYGECFNCLQYTETTNASVCQKELMKQAADAIEELNKLNAEITKRELKLRIRDTALCARRGRLLLGLLAERDIGRTIPPTN